MFVKQQIENFGWPGVKLCRPFIPKPLKIEDLDGKERSIHERASVLAQCYAKKQWHTSPLPRLPPRPPLFPIADELPTGPFTAQEMRTARTYVKKKKAPGTDEITNEILLLLLEFELTFFLMLEMFNKCWTDAVQPTEWQIAKIVAILKQKGSTKMPTNYRPIALLQAFYKFYTLLIDKRLRLIEHRVWRMQVGFRRDHSTDDANFLLHRID